MRGVPEASPVPDGVLDMWAPIVPSREIALAFARGFPEPMLGYLRVFFGREPTLATADDELDLASRPLTRLPFIVGTVVLSLGASFGL